MARKSRVILAKNIRLDKEYINVLNYTENQMLSLVSNASNKVAEATDYSFIRQNKNTIYTEFTYSQALNSNYIAFQNKDYDNKWFFAFIDEVIYRGDKNTEIKYTVDSFATWFPSVIIDDCFVERHHVNDDTIGKNIIDENLNIGDVIEESSTTDTSLNVSYGYWVALQTNWIIDNGSNVSNHNGKQFEGVSLYNGQLFGNQFVLFEINQATDVENVGLYILRTNSDGHINDIQNLFIIPPALIDEVHITQRTAYAGTGTNNPFIFYIPPYQSTPITYNTEITKVTSFTGLTIKNNKCFCYPYNFLLVTNNNGNHNIYKYEDFSDAKATFETALAISVGVSGNTTPKNYKGMSLDNDEAIPLGKYPTCSWSADAYINWLTQQAINAPTKILNFMNRTPATEIDIGLSLSNNLAVKFGEFINAHMLPNIEGGQNTADINYINNKNTFIYRSMRVKDDYLKSIDDYFTKYGYRILKITTPNITGRTYWNYVEIGKAEEIGHGDVPAKYLEEINKAFRRGTTVWHNHSNIGNFSLNNTIVT